MPDPRPTPNQVVDRFLRLYSSRCLDTYVPHQDLARIADLAVAALRYSGHLPTGQTQDEWCVWYGGDDPNECAGRQIYDEQARAEEMVQWIVGGRLARRTVHLGPWTAVEAS